MIYLGEVLCCFFFFKQKTAYEMRISDWSSDVCLPISPCGKARGDHGSSVEGSRKSALLRGPGNGRSFNFIGGSPTHGESGMGHQADLPEMRHPFLRPDRKSVV